jgi:hypothetical protein
MVTHYRTIQFLFRAPCQSASHQQSFINNYNPIGLFLLLFGGEHFVLLNITWNIFLFGAPKAQASNKITNI